MHFVLSNYEFRAYPTASGLLRLHLRTRAFFETTASFSVAAYMRHAAGRLTLADGVMLEIGERLGIVDDPETKFDGKTLVHELIIPVPTALRKIGNTSAWLELWFDFDFHGAQIHAQHEHVAWVRQIRLPRSVDRLANTR
jgi:hypothetical protein